MTPIDLQVKQDLRDFMEGELKAEANRRGTIVHDADRQRMEAFVDDMWVFINKRAGERAVKATEV